MATRATTLGPLRAVGWIVLGNGTTALTKIVPSKAHADKLLTSWKQRFTYTGTAVAMFSDGSVAGANAPAKAWLATQKVKNLLRFGRHGGINGDVARALIAA